MPGGYRNNQKNTGQRNNAGRSNNAENSSFPDNYLKGGYYKDEKKEILRKEYIVEYPRKLAWIFENDGGRDANKRSQLRKFYEYSLRVEKSIFYSENNFEKYEADINQLLPAVTYAKTRKVVSSKFVEFIDKNLKCIHDQKDFKAFIRHFEAILAFSKKDN